MAEYIKYNYKTKNSEEFRGKLQLLLTGNLLRSRGSKNKLMNPSKNVYKKLNKMILQSMLQIAELQYL